MKAAGAAILGAAVVGLGVLASSKAFAQEPAPDDNVDFDIDEEEQLAKNYYAMAITNPETWSDGELKSLEGLLSEFGMLKEADNIKTLRVVLYGETNVPPEPLPDIFFIPPSEVDAIADELEGNL